MTSWGQVSSGVEKTSHGCTLQPGLSSAVQADCSGQWDGRSSLSIPKIKGWINPKCECDHSEQGTATTSSELCSRHLHPHLALICFFLPQVESWLSHAFAEEVTDIKKKGPDFNSVHYANAIKVRYLNSV